jgi:NCS1 family nucleobase:cation symporter-1
MNQAETNRQSSSLYSEDLAPIPTHKRTWNTWNYAALWISMSLCIPTYMLASSLIGGGMSWWQAILTIFLGNTVVLIPMILNGHAGAKYGIPFPVFARASFGVKGANIPAMLRAIVACGWFGIQTWIGGYSIYLMLRLWVPVVNTLPQIFPASFGLQTGPAICFFLFWLLNMLVVYLGVESIRKLLVFKAFFLPLAALALFFWAISAANGLGSILQQPSKFTTNAAFWDFFFPALTGMVGFWATLSLNIPDFTRYAKSQKAQIMGQAIGLPPSMTLFSFIGVMVTSATAINFHGKMNMPIIPVISPPVLKLILLGARFAKSFAGLTIFAAMLVANVEIATAIIATVTKNLLSNFPARTKGSQIISP